MAHRTAGRRPLTGMLFVFARSRYDATTGMQQLYWECTRAVTAASFRLIQVRPQLLFALGLRVLRASTTNPRTFVSRPLCYRA